MATSGPDENLLERYAALFKPKPPSSTAWERFADWVTPKNPHTLAAILMSENGVVCPMLLDLMDPPATGCEDPATSSPTFKPKY